MNMERSSTDNLPEVTENTHITLVGKTAGKGQLEKLRHKWEYSIKVGFKETG